MLLVPLFAAAQLVCQNGVIATEFSRIAGVDKPASLTCADLEAAPRWLEQQEQPPLSPRAAIAAAKAALPQLVDNPAQWSFASVELKPMIVPETWIYVVQFYEARGRSLRRLPHSGADE